MAKSNEKLAVVAPANGATLHQTVSLQTYEETAKVMSGAVQQMRQTGEEYVKARLSVGYHLHLLASTGPRGALASFLKLAEGGHLKDAGFPRVGKRTLMNAKAFFVKAMRECGLQKDELLALKGEGSDVGGGDLFALTPPANAADAQARLMTWIAERGMASVDEELDDEGEGLKLTNKLPPPPDENRRQSGDDSAQAHADAVEHWDQLKVLLSTRFWAELDPEEHHELAVHLAEVSGLVSQAASERLKPKKGGR